MAAPDTSKPHAGRDALPPAVKVLGAVSLAQDAGSEMMYPFLPTFITGVLGAPVVAVGVAEGLADAAAAGMKLMAGRLAATRRRRWIGVGYGLATVGKLIVGLAFVWPVVLVGRTVDRIGKGIRGVPRDALIADLVDDRSRGRAFGLHRAMDTMGAVIGPLAGLGLYHLAHQQIRTVLLVALIPAVISVALVALVHEPPPPAPTPRLTPRPTPRPTQRPAPADTPDRSPLPPRFWQVMVPLGVFALVNSTDALLLQRAHELGLTVTETVLVYIVYNLVYATLAYPAGKIADRTGPQPVFTAGLIVFAITYLGFGLATTTAAAWVLFPFYGAFAALTDGVSRTWIANSVDTDQRTWALGIHGATTGVGVLVAGLWSGLAWNGAGTVPLTLSGIIALCIAAMLLPRAVAQARQARMSSAA